MSRFQIGLATLPMQNSETGEAPPWSRMRREVTAAETAGFDTFWVPDELQWEVGEGDPPLGFWECLTLTGALAASTTTIGVGTWVVSALHRNPGIAAKAAVTLDEISGGRFLFGLGSGHAGRQGAAFGFPPDKTVSRYEEALLIIRSLLDTGEASFEGRFHSADRQVLGPLGPSGRRIPLMLGGHGPRTMRLAVDHGDIWSAYATTSSRPEAFVDLIRRLDAICEEAGRDPATLGRSIGVVAVAPGEPAPSGPFYENPIAGSVDQIAETVLEFRSMGCTRLEFLMVGDLERQCEAIAPVLDTIHRA